MTPYFLFWGICVPRPEKADFSPIRKQIRLNIAIYITAPLGRAES